MFPDVSGTWEYMPLHGKREFADAIKDFEVGRFILDFGVKARRNHKGGRKVRVGSRCDQESRGGSAVGSWAQEGRL